MDGDREPVDEIHEAQRVPPVQVLRSPEAHGPSHADEFEEPEEEEPRRAGEEIEGDCRNDVAGKKPPAVGESRSPRFRGVDSDIRREQERQEAVQESRVRDQVRAENDAERSNDRPDRYKREDKRAPDAHGLSLFPPRENAAAEQLRMRHSGRAPQMPTLTIALRRIPVPPRGAWASSGK